jgi:hypothetical protein
MKRLSIVLLVSCVLLTAYASALSPPSNDPVQVRPTARIQNTTYYTKRCWPACHYDDTLIKPAPIPDINDFNDTLEPHWSWISEDPTHWTLTGVPGVLRIVTQVGSISGDLQDARNVLVRQAPASHIDIMTEVAFNPVSDSQFATIFIQTDDDRLVSLSRGYCRGGDASFCVESGVYFDCSELGGPQASLESSAQVVYLMLRKAGNSYVGYLLSGDDWVEVGRCYDATAVPSSVGLAAVGTPEIPADFDSFTMVERP